MKVNTITQKLLLAGVLTLSAGASLAFETKYTGSCKLLSPEQADPNREKQKVQLYEEVTYKALSKSQDPIGKQQYDEAIAILLPLLDRNLKAFDKANVEHNLSFLYAQKQQWQKAIEFEAKAVAANQLQEQTQMQARQNLVYFSAATENHAKTLEALKDYFAHTWGVKPDMYVLMANVYSQMNRYQDAICPAYIAITRHPSPKQSWFSMILQSHYELKDFDGSIAISKEMVERFNDKSSWNQLSNLYLKVERDQDALTVMELANLRGFLEKENDFKNLASLYSVNEIPYKSAAVLEQAVEEGKIAASEKAWKSIGQSWSTARELDKAVRAYAEADKFVNDGSYHMYVGEIRSEQEKWKEAVTAFQKAIEKGALKDIGRAYLNLGIAQFNNGELNKALANLEKATQYEKQAKTASQWIAYINERIRSRG